MSRPERIFRPGAFLMGAALLSGALFDGAAAEKPQQAVLTRETYRQRCLLCHKVPPYGIAPEIVAGLAVRPGVSPSDLMPGTSCWRRCVKCWPEPRAAR